MTMLPSEPPVVPIAVVGRIGVDIGVRATRRAINHENVFATFGVRIAAPLPADIDRTGDGEGGILDHVQFAMAARHAAPEADAAEGGNVIAALPLRVAYDMVF